jgi:site-specific DNA-methyltransferase (adenine-specific)
MNNAICEIFHGDCALVMEEKIADNSIDLTVTSPPYDNLRDYHGYTFDFESIAAQLWRVTKPGGVIVWVVADATINGSETGTSFKQALHFMGLGLRLHDTMIHTSEKPPLTHNRYEQGFQYMFVFSKGRPNTFNPILKKNRYSGRKRKATYREKNGNTRGQNTGGRVFERSIKDNVWNSKKGYGQDTPDPYAHVHPATFPESLARDHIVSWSNPSGIILDPMCGSGTTLKMAKELGRQYVGIDISQEYVSLACRRIAGAKNPLPGFAELLESQP